MQFLWLRWIEQRWVVFLLMLLIHGPLVIRPGPLYAPDSELYVGLGDHLIAHGLYFSGSPAWMKPLFAQRAGFILIVVLCKIIGRGYWDELFLWLNLAADALVGVLVTMLVIRITRSRLAGWAAVAAYLLSFDTVLWARYILSDTIFLLASFAAFYFVAEAVRQPGRGRLFWPLAAVAITLSLIIRPPGVLLIPLALAGWLVLRGLQKNEANIAGLRRPWRAFGLLTVTVLVIWFGLIGLMQDPSHWPFPGSSVMDGLGQFFRQGVVIHDRPETYHQPPQGFLDFVLIGVDRVIHFFQFLSSSFSPAHNLYGIGYFLPLYLLAAAGLALFFLRRLGLTAQAEASVLLSILAVLLFVLFHSITLMDFDWRYRLPVVPHLILLAALPFRLAEQIVFRRWPRWRGIGENVSHAAA
jgi:4-amino-4-deoxy-L-arabinose transferase-like glycosyltransferase